MNKEDKKILKPDHIYIIPGKESITVKENDIRIQQLEQELAQTRENMRSTIKAQDAAIEEWRSAHEELIRCSEELRVLNEELEEKVLQRTLELSDANGLLQERNNELGRMNKELESFSYVSGHDLQEPLRKIQTFAARILEKEYAVLSDKGKDYFSRMQSAAGRMQQLIEDLLAFFRINLDERKLENIDLNKIVEKVKYELKEAIEDKQAVIVTKELCEANIVPFQFCQLMHQLISNALKFSKPGAPPQIIITSRNIICSKENELHLLPGKEYCHITFSDNGIGFEPHFSKQIFEVFQKLHGQDEYRGTGIGLAIVKKIVENHHGFITATSELGNGATFDIYIPV